ncbi:MAG: DUF3078 domain-containing protein [Bacteroidaceae bacterium]|nr:DUF3078 domain-containing protein [Bacteroidaceae bacterium]
MTKFYSLVVVCLFMLPAYASERIASKTPTANDSIYAAYEQALELLAQTRDESLSNVASKAENMQLNPYFFRLMTPGTYYGRPLHQVMGISWPQTSPSAISPALGATEASDYALAQLYVNNPGLISRTEEVLKEEPALREEIKSPVTVVEPKLAEKAVVVDLETDMPDTITVIPKKPNFWKFKGNASLQFTQSYFSENWYQGGENNYQGIGMLTLEANYDNKRKVQWDNKLEAQLGFQTTTSDDYHKFRVTSNLLRLTSKLGYKAAKNWFYTGQVMSYTQLAPYYEKNKQDWKSCFGTPLYLTVSVGMDYKYKSKNGKVDLSVYMSPLAYYMTYVGKLHSRHFDMDDEGNMLLDGSGYGRYKYWYTRTYGMEHMDDHFLHKFGPNLTVNSKIKIMKNVMWTSRFYWFSNFHSTLFEWENTLDFTINKYLSAKFYAYPRFDDSSRNYKREHGYLMFKEWLSLGLNYSF